MFCSREFGNVQRLKAALTAEQDYMQKKLSFFKAAACRQESAARRRQDFEGVKISIKVALILLRPGSYPPGYIGKMKEMVARPLRWFARLSAAILALSVATLLFGQVIEYEANGLKYQTLSHKGLTIIVTRMPNQVAGFGLFQVSISNGSDIYWTVQPEDFSYIKQDLPLTAIPAGQVVDVLLDKGSHSDVVKLVTSYENLLYGIPHMKTTNGYEMRRQGAMTIGINAKLKAAATASAIALAQTRLAPGQSTDGSIFIPLTHDIKALTGGHLVFKNYGETFEFNPD
jgi:hypothetical protein